MKILNQYQETKQAIEILTAELKELQPKLIEELQKVDGPVKTKTATFSLRSSKTYEFSDSLCQIAEGMGDQISDLKDTIKSKETVVKNLKESEIKDGKAKVKSETFTPVMRVIKNK